MPTSWEKLWNFYRRFPKEWGVHEKNGAWFQGRMREIWPKQARVLRIQTCSHAFYLNWNFRNQSSWLRKIVKFWENFPWRIRSLWKKMVHNSEFGWGRYGQNRPKCSELRHTPINSNWAKTSGWPHFLPMAWYQQLGKWPRWHSKMNHTRTTMNHIRT